VVIAIIAILAAILFPVFAKAREKARQSSCLSNTRQIGTAFMSYAQDYDECLPGMDNDVVNWYVLLQPYIKNTQIFVCPSRNNYPGYGCCWYNMMVDWTAAGTNILRGQSLGNITRPADALLFTESEGSDGSVAYYVDSLRCVAFGTYAAPRNYDNMPYPGRHNGGNNCGFCDGHAKWVSFMDLRSTSWSGWTSQPSTIQ